MSNLDKLEEAMEWNMGETFFEYLARISFLDKLINRDVLETDQLTDEEIEHFYRSVGIR